MISLEIENSYIDLFNDTVLSENQTENRAANNLR